MVRWVALAGLFWVMAFASLAGAEAPAPEGGEGRMAEAPAVAADAEAADQEAADEETGVDLLIPVGRLGWGTVRSVEPGSLGGFAFDLAVGARLLFQELGEAEGGDERRWRPALTGELGYSRQAGDYGTHQLTLGLGFGFLTEYIGLHLFETVALGVSGERRHGLRSTLRLDTLWGLVFFDLGHGATFGGGTTTHDIRGVIGVDLGLLVSLFVLVGVLH